MSKFFEYRNFRIIGEPGNYRLISTLSLKSNVKLKSKVTRKFVSLDVKPSEIVTVIIKGKGDSFSSQYVLKSKAVRNYKTVYDLIDALYKLSSNKTQFKNLVSIPDNLIKSNKQLIVLLKDRFVKLDNKPIPAKFTEFTDCESGQTLEMSSEGVFSSELRQQFIEKERELLTKHDKIIADSTAKLCNMIMSESENGYTLNNNSTIDDSFKQLFEKTKNYRLYRSINGHVGLLISADSDGSHFDIPTAGQISFKKLPNNCKPFSQSFADSNISELSIIYPGNHEVHKFYNFNTDDIIIDYIIDNYKFIRSKFAMAFEKASTSAKQEMPYINLVLPFIAEKLGLTIYDGEQPRYAWSTVGDKIVSAKFAEFKTTQFDSKSKATSNFMMAQTLKYLGILNETQLNQISVHVAGTLFETLVYMAERESKFELRDKLLDTLFELSRKVTKNS